MQLRATTIFLTIVVTALLAGCKGTPPASATLMPTEPGTQLKLIINHSGQIGIAEGSTELSEKTIKSSTTKGALIGLSKLGRVRRRPA